MGMSEPGRELQYIMARLTGGATGALAKVWLGVAPADAAQPFVIITPPAKGNDDVGSGHRRVFTDNVWTVKAVGLVADSGAAAVIALADAIDTDLDRTSGTAGLTDARVLACVRDGTVMYTDWQEPNNELWLHLGGLYQVESQALTA